MLFRSGQRGVAPEWFYKGNGTILRGPREPLEIPEFALDGGEEPEIVGCYVINKLGVPTRLGFSLGNEWSDHATEKINYLYLARRSCARARSGRNSIPIGISKRSRCAAR